MWAATVLKYLLLKIDTVLCTKWTNLGQHDQSLTTFTLTFTKSVTIFVSYFFFSIGGLIFIINNIGKETRRIKETLKLTT